MVRKVVFRNINQIYIGGQLKILIKRKSLKIIKPQNKI